MIITTTETIPNEKITEVLGIVKGNTIRARHIGRDVMAGLKSIVGGEIKSYTEMITKSREEALQRMIDEAENLVYNKFRAAVIWARAKIEGEF